ncbi:uncharacterized protein LOC141830555 [Curcuma longa]|uniref:uncharacterized protein LOC141830555 n=1 Tax=Curcuma longa TaxID=136217 RepID=UPI003D9FAADF
MTKASKKPRRVIRKGFLSSPDFLLPLPKLPFASHFSPTPPDCFARTRLRGSSSPRASLPLPRLLRANQAPLRLALLSHSPDCFARTRRAPKLSASSSFRRAPKLSSSSSFFAALGFRAALLRPHHSSRAQGASPLLLASARTRDQLFFLAPATREQLFFLATETQRSGRRDHSSSSYSRSEATHPCYSQAEVVKSTMDSKHLYQQVAAVALLCVQREPSERPLITDTIIMDLRQ